MEERNEISVELSAISALVGGISRQTPYGVPVGYFDRLPVAVMGRITASSSILPGSPVFADSPVFQIPSQTFQVPVPSPTFQVPDGYFDGFATQVLNRIKTGATIGQTGDDELPLIFNQISRITPYQVPEGFFDELSPVLTVAHDRSAYRVPEGYFVSLAGQILEKVVPNVVRPVVDVEVAGPITGARVAPAKVIPIDRGNTGKVLKGNWWIYSSFASIAACLLLIFSWPQMDNKTGAGNATAMISQDLQKVSDQEMQAYLDDQHSLLVDPLDKSTATLDMNEGDVKSLLGDVSDKDLQQYMEEHGKAGDLATN